MKKVILGFVLISSMLIIYPSVAFAEENVPVTDETVLYEVDEALNDEEISVGNEVSFEEDSPSDVDALENEDPITEAESSEAIVSATESVQTVLTGFQTETLPDGRAITVYYENGIRLTNQRYINGYWYMFLPETGEMVTGFYNHTSLSNPTGGPKTCYYDENGHMVYNQRYIDGYWYMFAPGSGAMVRGFYNHTVQTNPAGGAKICYYDANGHMVYNQRYIDGYWYMFAPGSGAMVRGFYNHTAQTNPAGGSKTCYYDANGHMVYNQRYIDGHWYMFAPGSGAMMRGFYNHTAQTNPTGGPKTCYYDANGRLVYNQRYINGYWYMFAPGSGAMVRGFYNHSAQTNPAGGAKTCYYDAQGHMLYGRQVIDGKTYIFDSGSGALNVARTEYPQASAVLDQVGWDLRAAFDWVSSKPYTTEAIDLDTRTYANMMFTNGHGNCYCYAAAFYEMARALGYDAHQIRGHVRTRGGGMDPHSWVEIVINGQIYVFDGSFHHAGGNGYMRQYGQPGTFQYADYYRMN